MYNDVYRFVFYNNILYSFPPGLPLSFPRIPYFQISVLPDKITSTNAFSATFNQSSSTVIVISLFIYFVIHPPLSQIRIKIILFCFPRELKHISCFDVDVTLNNCYVLSHESIVIYEVFVLMNMTDIHLKIFGNPPTLFSEIL